MTDTFKRVSAALTNDAIPHANNSIYTCPSSTKTILFDASVSNVDTAVPANVDVTVDVGGAGTTIRYVAKSVPVAAGATIVLPKIALEPTDILRVRASANSSLQFYGPLVEIT